MPKTLATATGIDMAAFDRAQAKFAALKAIQLQSDLINDMRARSARSEAREMARLDEMRAHAEKLGAFDIIAPMQRVAS